MEEFHKIINNYSKPFGFVVSKLANTRHWNVLRIYDPSTKTYYVAKGIMHIKNDNEMGPTQMNRAYNNEVSILAKLPDWWGLYVKDSFKEGDFRIIITPELPNCKWDTYKGNNDDVISTKLYKQIEWLHKNNIAHNDLELKNVMLDCDNKNATIIDFEKSSISASNSAMRVDYKKIIDNLNEREHTKGIGTKLEQLAFGKLTNIQNVSSGGHKRKTRKRKTRKHKK